MDFNPSPILDVQHGWNLENVPFQDLVIGGKLYILKPWLANSIARISALPFDNTTSASVRKAHVIAVRWLCLQSARAQEKDFEGADVEVVTLYNVLQ